LIGGRVPVRYSDVSPISNQIQIVMSKLKILKLGTIVLDSVTGLKGMLTHFNTDMSHNQNYLFQPQKLNPETGQPVDTYWLNSERIPLATEVEAELPLNLIGTEAEDTASGYKGTVIGLCLHLNGCVHAELKAKGVTKKNNEPIKAIDVDIRRLKGKAIEPMTEKAFEKSKKDKPSPQFKPSLQKR
jgi:hypothetical protein